MYSNHRLQHSLKKLIQGHNAKALDTQVKVPLSLPQSDQVPSSAQPSSPFSASPPWFSPLNTLESDPHGPGPEEWAEGLS